MCGNAWSEAVVCAVLAPVGSDIMVLMINGLRYLCQKTAVKHYNSTSMSTSIRKAHSVNFLSTPPRNRNQESMHAPTSYSMASNAVVYLVT